MMKSSGEKFLTLVSTVITGFLRQTELVKDQCTGSKNGGVLPDGWNVRSARRHGLVTTVFLSLPLLTANRLRKKK